MQVGRGRDRLVGGDVAGEAAARVGRVVGRAQRQRVAERRAPGRVGERLLGLQAQAVARHHPAHPLDQPGRDQPRGGDHRQQRLAAARGDRGEDVARLGLAGGDGLDHAGEALLMGAERANSQGGTGSLKGGSDLESCRRGCPEPGSDRARGADLHSAPG